MRKLFTTALVLGSVATLGACQTTTNKEIPVPCGLERTVCYETATNVVKATPKKTYHKKTSRLERTYSSAQSK